MCKDYVIIKGYPGTGKIPVYRATGVQAFFCFMLVPTISCRRHSDFRLSVGESA